MTPRTGRLGPSERDSAIAALTEQTFDLVVVGGGVTGCGVALDAATRGLSVALLEARDLASGTSSRSGKTFHGGLRYLEQFNFSLVHQALHERDLMVRTLCPHLARPQPFLYPLVGRGWERPYVGAGVALYDLMAGVRNTVPRHRHLSRRAVEREAPALDAAKLSGAVRYWDVRVDDARHTMTVARTAARYGARIVTRMPVVEMLRENGRVSGVRARDENGGTTVTVHARCVVNATGAWADRVAGLAGPPGLKVKPAKGIHLVVPRDRIDSRSGMLARTEDSVLVIRPWWEHWIIGTTDTPWDGPLEEPRVTDGDVDYVLRETNKWLRRPLSREDVSGTYAGVRPLLAPADGGAAETTAALSRDHAVAETAPGLVTVVGGKYTTYRVMAADAVDACPLGRIPPSCTENVPLLGADGWHALSNQVGALAGETGLAPAAVEHLLDRYGSVATDLFDLIADRPELAEPVAGPYLAAEIVYAAAAEGASTVEDVMSRRAHIDIEYGDGAAPEVARLLGETLGWSEAAKADELTRWARRPRW